MQPTTSDNHAAAPVRALASAPCSLPVSSGAALIGHWEARADYRRGRGWEDSAMAFQYCANQLRAAIGMSERRQSTENTKMNHSPKPSAHEQPDAAS